MWTSRSQGALFLALLVLAVVPPRDGIAATQRAIQSEPAPGEDGSVLVTISPAAGLDSGARGSVYRFSKGRWVKVASVVFLERLGDAQGMGSATPGAGWSVLQRDIVVFEGEDMPPPPATLTLVARGELAELSVTDVGGDRHEVGSVKQGEETVLHLAPGRTHVFARMHDGSLLDETVDVHGSVRFVLSGGAGSPGRDAVLPFALAAVRFRDALRSASSENIRGAMTEASYWRTLQPWKVLARSELDAEVEEIRRLGNHALVALRDGARDSARAVGMRLRDRLLVAGRRRYEALPVEDRIRLIKGGLDPFRLELLRLGSSDLGPHERAMSERLELLVAEDLEAWADERAWEHLDAGQRAALAPCPGILGRRPDEGQEACAWALGLDLAQPSPTVARLSSAGAAVAELDAVAWEQAALLLERRLREVPIDLTLDRSSCESDGRRATCQASRAAGERVAVLLEEEGGEWRVTETMPPVWDLAMRGSPTARSVPRHRKRSRHPALPRSRGPGMSRRRSTAAALLFLLAASSVGARPKSALESELEQGLSGRRAVMRLRAGCTATFRSSAGQEQREAVLQIAPHGGVSYKEPKAGSGGFLGKLAAGGSDAPVRIGGWTKCIEPGTSVVIAGVDVDPKRIDVKVMDGPGSVAHVHLVRLSDGESSAAYLRMLATALEVEGVTVSSPPRGASELEQLDAEMAALMTERLRLFDAFTRAYDTPEQAQAAIPLRTHLNRMIENRRRAAILGSAGALHEQRGLEEELGLTEPRGAR